MKPKVFVLISLMLSILVAGLILILGYASDTLLPLYLVAFLIVFVIVTMLLLKSLFTDKMFVVMIIMLILLAMSLALLLTNLKNYYDVVNFYEDSNNLDELNQMQSQIDYNLAYVDYLNQEIIAYKAQSKSMQDQLTGLKRLQLEQAIQQYNDALLANSITVTNNDVTGILVEDTTIPVITEYYYENDDYEEDD